MDVFAAKELHRALGENLKNFEDKYGPIEKPDAQVKAEELAKQHKEQGPSVTVPERPSYFG